MLIVAAFWVKELVDRLDGSDLWDVDLDDDDGGVGGVVVADACDVIDDLDDDDGVVGGVVVANACDMIDDLDDDDGVVATNACGVVAVWRHLKRTFLSWAYWKSETGKKKEITK